MPTYQYACTNPECAHQFEQFQAFTDPSLTECPVCAQSVRKVYGSVGVVFKGSGFYRNDSRDAKTTATPAAAGDAGAKSAGSSGDGGKSDGGSGSTTTATKSDTKSDSKSATPTPSSAGASSSSGGSNGASKAASVS